MKRSSPRVSHWLLMFLACCAVLTSAPAISFPQEVDQAAAATAKPDQPEEHSLGMLIVSSNAVGLVFYVTLAAFSIFGVAVAAERLVNLTRRKVLPPEFVQALRDLRRREDDTADELLLLAERSKSPIAEILKAGALRGGRPVPEVEKAMEDAAANQIAELRSRHRGLSVVGNVAPLVGLLGTVVGMIFAFNEASDIGLGKGEALAHGIYLALFTTAIGLAIAIPALLCVAWFNGRLERYFREIDQELQPLHPSLVRMEREASVVASV